MQDIWVRSLGWEDPLGKGMGTHSSILAWRIPWTDEFGRLQSMGSQRVGHDWATNTFTSPGLSFRMQDLVPWLGNKPGPPGLGAWSLSHWTTREVSTFVNYFNSHLVLCRSVCPALGDPVDYGLSSFPVHGIFQARILEWVAMSSSRSSLWPRDWTQVSCLGRWVLYHWATWEAHQVGRS